MIRLDAVISFVWRMIFVIQLDVYRNCVYNWPSLWLANNVGIISWNIYFRNSTIGGDKGNINRLPRTRVICIWPGNRIIICKILGDWHYLMSIWKWVSCSWKYQICITIKITQHISPTVQQVVCKLGQINFSFENGTPIVSTIWVLKERHLFSTQYQVGFVMKQLSPRNFWRSLRAITKRHLDIIPIVWELSTSNSI